MNRNVCRWQTVLSYPDKTWLTWHSDENQKGESVVLLSLLLLLVGQTLWPLSKLQQTTLQLLHSSGYQSSCRHLNLPINGCSPTDYPFASEGRGGNTIFFLPLGGSAFRSSTRILVVASFVTVELPTGHVVCSQDTSRDSMSLIIQRKFFSSPFFVGLDW
jgi:hypothetical protein